MADDIKWLSGVGIAIMGWVYSLGVQSRKIDDLCKSSADKETRIRIVEKSMTTIEANTYWIMKKLNGDEPEIAK